MNFKVFLLIFILPIFLSKYPLIFTDISDISVKSKYRYIRNYRYFVPCYQLHEIRKSIIGSSCLSHVIEGSTFQKDKT